MAMGIYNRNYLMRHEGKPQGIDMRHALVSSPSLF